jgi:hypothetical protein
MLEQFDNQCSLFLLHEKMALLVSFLHHNFADSGFTVHTHHHHSVKLGLILSVLLAFQLVNNNAKYRWAFSRGDCY